MRPQTYTFSIKKSLVKIDGLHIYPETHYPHIKVHRIIHLNTRPTQPPPQKASHLLRPKEYVKCFLASAEMAKQRHATHQNRTRIYIFVCHVNGMQRKIYIHTYVLS